MNDKSRRLNDYLRHIIEAVLRIQRYTASMNEQMFLGDSLVQDAVVRNFEIIGEASRNIQLRFPEFVVAHPELPLVAAYEMRNALAHGYFQVDFEIVWRTIERDLPGLASEVQRLIDSELHGDRS